jgi:hypothetical protein
MESSTAFSFASSSDCWFLMLSSIAPLDANQSSQHRGFVNLHVIIDGHWDGGVSGWNVFGHDAAGQDAIQRHLCVSCLEFWRRDGVNGFSVVQQLSIFVPET